MTRFRITPRIASWLGLLALAVCMTGATRCEAQATFLVSMDTSPLMSASGGPFSIDFQLIDGSGTGDANNTVTLSDFAFGAGGGPLGDPAPPLGDVIGDLSSSVTLTDSLPFNEFAQTFTPGDRFSFVLRMTTNMDVPDPCDQFSFAILDGLTVIPTEGPGNAFLAADLCPPTVSAFGTSASASVSLAAPLVLPVPEPTPAGWQLSLAMLSAWGLHRRRRAPRR